MENWDTEYLDENDEWDGNGEINEGEVVEEDDQEEVEKEEVEEESESFSGKDEDSMFVECLKKFGKILLQKSQTPVVRLKKKRCNK